MTVAKRLNLRLFIDGLEVPVIGARCTFTEGADAQADVQVIATDQVYDILPRAFVQIFYYQDADYTEVSGKESGFGHEDPRRWKLLFLGELAGVRVDKRESQRHAILSCVGPMNYLDFIRQHYVNFRNGGVELIENAFLGVSADRAKNFDVVGKDVYSNVFVWLSASKVEVTDPETGKKEKYSNIYTGTQRLIREMFFGSSTFYAQAFNRLRIGDMVVGLPEDKTAAKLMKLSFFQKFIKGQIGGAGGLVSARQMTSLLLGTVLHSMTTIPCPRFDPEGKALGLDIQKKAPNLWSETVKNQIHPGASLNYVLIKPDTWFLTPPVCNIVFPHQYRTFTYQRDYLAEPTRLMLRTSLFFTGRDKWMTERFYAPDFAAINDVMYSKGGHLDRMSQILLGHEEFVGLNPLFTWESDLGAYVQKGSRREYLSKLADYMFWKYRFSTRTTNVSGPFNPNLVPGYPGLVMDKVGSPGHITRHIMGNIQSVVHSIDQEGGYTNFTMVGCYQHDEAADFDGKGRSLNEVTRRGTDGFLDDRYDVENIDQVYETLFGCSSLTHFITGQADPGDLHEAFKEAINDTTWDDEDPIIRSVAVLQLLYQNVIQNEGDIQAFTQSMTQRPVANLVQLLGVPGHAGLVSSEEVRKEIYWMDQVDEWEGFFSAAVDQESPVDDTYTASKSYTKTTSKVEGGEEVYGEREDGAKILVAKTVERTTYSSRTVTKSEETSYGLKEMLEKRQASVQLYLDSLLHRGIRG